MSGPEAKVPCKTMQPVITALETAELALRNAEESYSYHKTEAEARRSQVRLLKLTSQTLVDACTNCEGTGEQTDSCTALIAYNEVRSLTVGPMTTGIGQDMKINMGFGN